VIIQRACEAGGESASPGDGEAELGGTTPQYQGACKAGDRW